MTSYANDTTTTAAAPPATTTTTTAATPAATTTATGTVAAAAATHAAGIDASSAKQMSSSNNNRSHSHSQSHYEEDDNSSLDGREKADTTPENIKKIAEIISDNEATSPMSPSTPKLQQLHTSSFVGLGAAIDESNVKFCLGKPPPLPAEKGE